jgi:hypothetical protein
VFRECWADLTVLGSFQGDAMPVAGDCAIRCEAGECECECGGVAGRMITITVVATGIIISTDRQAGRETDTYTTHPGDINPQLQNHRGHTLMMARSFIRPSMSRYSTVV